MGDEAADRGAVQATSGLAGEQPALEQLHEQLPGDSQMPPASPSTVSTADRGERLVEACISFAISCRDRGVRRKRGSSARKDIGMNGEGTDTGSERQGLRHVARRA